MPVDKNSASSSDAERPSFVRQLVADPKRPPKTLLLSGYLGDSSEEGHTRLYFDLELSSYVEISNDDILLQRPMPGGQAPLEASYVWVRRDAALRPSAQAASPGANFLVGQMLPGPTGTVRCTDVGPLCGEGTAFPMCPFPSTPAAGCAVPSTPAAGCQPTTPAVGCAVPSTPAAGCLVTTPAGGCPAPSTPAAGCQTPFSVPVCHTVEYGLCKTMPVLCPTNVARCPTAFERCGGNFAVPQQADQTAQAAPANLPLQTIALCPATIFQPFCPTRTPIQCAPSVVQCAPSVGRICPTDLFGCGQTQIFPRCAPTLPPACSPITFGGGCWPSIVCPSLACPSIACNPQTIPGDPGYGGFGTFGTFGY
jgi:hypothetical protein